MITYGAIFLSNYHVSEVHTNNTRRQPVLSDACWSRLQDVIWRQRHNPKPTVTWYICLATITDHDKTVLSLEFSLKKHFKQYLVTRKIFHGKWCVVCQQVCHHSAPPPPPPPPTHTHTCTTHTSLKSSCEGYVPMFAWTPLKPLCGRWNNSVLLSSCCHFIIKDKSFSNMIWIKCTAYDI